jgi:hypothetical protein
MKLWRSQLIRYAEQVEQLERQAQSLHLADQQITLKLRRALERKGLEEARVLFMQAARSDELGRKRENEKQRRVQALEASARQLGVLPVLESKLRLGEYDDVELQIILWRKRLEKAETLGVAEQVLAFVQLERPEDALKLLADAEILQQRQEDLEKYRNRVARLSPPSQSEAEALLRQLEAVPSFGSRAWRLAMHPLDRYLNQHGR